MGFVASLPFLLKAIVGPLGGVVADILRNGHMSTVNVRRLFYILGKNCKSYNADLLSWMRSKSIIAFRSVADTWRARGCNCPPILARTQISCSKTMETINNVFTETIASPPPPLIFGNVSATVSVENS